MARVGFLMFAKLVRSPVRTDRGNASNPSRSPLSNVPGYSPGMPRLSAVVLVSILICSPCFGWGPEGHKIIGTIASAALDDGAAKAIRELLGDQSIADACCWADDVRADVRYDWVKPLHY